MFERRLLNSIIVSRPLPRNFRASDYELFRREISRTLPGVTIDEIHDAVVRDDILLSESQARKQLPLSKLKPNWSRHETAKHIALRAKHTISRPTNSREVTEALWISDGYSRNYYHWLVDSLQRLVAAREAGIDAPILLPKEDAERAYIADSLALLGEKVIQINPGELTQVRRLYRPSLVSTPGNPRPELLQKVRSRLLLAIQDTKHYVREGGPGIWTTRPGGRNRSVENEAAIQDAIKFGGFQCVNTQNMALSEQVLLFRKSSAIAGPHGAALTNMLFLPSGASVVEIRRHDDNRNNAYFSMAAALKLNYYYLTCPPVDRKNRKPMIVDPADLKTILLALERPPSDL